MWPRRGARRDSDRLSFALATAPTSSGLPRSPPTPYRDLLPPRPAHRCCSRQGGIDLAVSSMTSSRTIHAAAFALAICVSAGAARADDATELEYPENQYDARRYA